MTDVVVQSIPKDHYIPQLYLDAFAIEGAGHKTPHIYQYMQDKVVCSRIKDVASEKHFYTVKHKDTGEPLRDIDNFFTQAEGLAAGPLKKVIETQDVDSLEDKELADLAVFIALLAVRTPGFINGMQSMEEESIKEFMALDAMDLPHFKKNLEKAGIFLSDKELEEQQRFVIEKRYSVSFGNRGHFFAQGLEVAKDLAQWYYEQKHWHMLASNSDRVFLTSDNPVSIYRPVSIPRAMNAGYGNGTLLIPIAPKLALLLRDVPHRTKKIKLNDKRVDDLNKNTMKFSNNYVFSNLASKQIHQMYKGIGNKQFQKVNVVRHKFAPYVFMSPPPVPQEPLFKSDRGDSNSITTDNQLHSRMP